MSKIYIKYGDFEFNSISGYPVPNASFGINHNRTGPGDYLSSEQTVSLQGVCYALRMTEQNDTRGYSKLPDNAAANGKNDTLDALFFKANHLHKKMTQNNNKLLFIALQTNANTYKPLVSGNAILEDITFSENQNNWTSTIDYELQFKILVANTGSRLLASGNTSLDNYVTSVTDNYSLEAVYDNQDKYKGAATYKLTRNIGAVGSRVLAASGALYHAKKWVIDRADYVPTTGVFVPEYFTLYNQERSINLSEVDGSYSITDSFIAKSGDPWIETYNISIDVDETFKRTIKIDGTIQGLTPATGVYGTGFIQVTTQNGNVVFPSGKQDIQPTITGLIGGFGDTTDNGLVTLSNGQKAYRTKYGNAVSGYHYLSNVVFPRANDYDIASQNLVSSNFNPGVFSNHKTKPLNSIPLSVNEAFYPFEGKITYSRTYDTRYSSIISGSIAESFSIDDKMPTIRTEEIQVLGRRLGPIVYEYYGSTTMGTRTISYEGYFPTPTGSMKKYEFPKQIMKNIESTLSLYRPAGNYLVSHVTSDTQDYNITNNKISRSITWEYTTCSGT